MATKKITGNDVRALREGLDMSTVQFGKLLGLGPSAVTRWESKKGNAVHMDPFAARVAEIIVAQSKKLGKTKFGKIVSDALAHEHDLFALWQILSLAFGETVRVVKKVAGGGKKREAKKREAAGRPGKRARKAAKRGVKASERRIRNRRASRPARAARRTARTKRVAKVAPAGKSKRARPASDRAARPSASARPSAGETESKVTPSAAKDAVEGTNGVHQ